MSKKIILLSIILLSLPFFVFSQFNVGNIQQPPQAIGNPVSNPIIDTINRVINLVVWPIVVTIVIVLFIMAGFKFITAQGEPAKLEEARRFVIWGTIGVIVILIAFSIIETIKWIFSF